MTPYTAEPPDHPQLDEARIQQLRTALVAEASAQQRGPRQSRSRARSSLVAFIALVLLLLVTGGGYALNRWSPSLFDLDTNDPTVPRRVGERVIVAAEDNWTLQAWKSTRGICVGVTVGGDPSFSGCGWPVVGAPKDTVIEQPPDTARVGRLIAGGGGHPVFVAGPLAQDVDRVEIQFIDGNTVDAPIYTAPAALGVPLKFYLVRETVEERDAQAPVNPVRWVRAYGPDGSLLQELTPTT